jgi:tetrahydromethanopterin S-methyltransferase subunit F
MADTQAGPEESESMSTRTTGMIIGALVFIALLFWLLHLYDWGAY